MFFEYFFICATVQSKNSASNSDGGSFKPLELKHDKRAEIQEVSRVPLKRRFSVSAIQDISFIIRDTSFITSLKIAALWWIIRWIF